MEMGTYPLCTEKAQITALESVTSKGGVHLTRTVAAAGARNPQLKCGLECVLLFCQKPEHAGLGRRRGGVATHHTPHCLVRSPLSMFARPGVQARTRSTRALPVSWKLSWSLTPAGPQDERQVEERLCLAVGMMDPDATEKQARTWELNCASPKVHMLTF